MSEIKKKEHDAWIRGFRTGTQSAIDVINRHVKENNIISFKELILRIKVNQLNTRAPE